MDQSEIITQIKKYIVDFGPQKARDLMQRFRNRGSIIDKTEINQVLHRNIKEFNKNEITYKWDVQKPTLKSDVKTQVFYKESFQNNSLETIDFQEKVSKYSSNNITYQSYFSIAAEKRIEYKNDIINSRSELNKSRENLIDFIVTSNYPLSSIQDSDYVSSQLYRTIINHKKVKAWIQTKQDDNEIKNLSEEEKHKEFEVLAIKAWEDGIITEEEDASLKSLQDELGLNTKIAQEILEKVEGEYLAKQKAEEQTQSFNVVKLNNTKFIIKKAKLPYQSIFIYEFDNTNGAELITLNLAHELYKKESEKLIIQMACSLYFTKLSMTSREISIFLDRFHQNLKLIE